MPTSHQLLNTLNYPNHNNKQLLYTQDTVTESKRVYNLTPNEGLSKDGSRIVDVFYTCSSVTIS